MNEMVERVARAILAESQNMGALAHHLKGRNAIETRLAQAAIEAMREPTESMRIAAIKTPLPAFVDDIPLYEKIWRGMIDAALADPSWSRRSVSGKQAPTRKPGSWLLCGGIMPPPFASPS